MKDAQCALTLHVACVIEIMTPFLISMKWYTTTLLCCTVFFLFADQNLLAPNLSEAADEFGMSEDERDEKLGGYIAFGFFVVGGPVALLVGYFTDIVNRCILFSAVVAFGETACLATYWVQTYEQFFICRVLTGVSIGGATPIIFSMLGDMFPESERVYVSSLVGIALSAGIAGGQLLAGLVGPSLGWRVPFLLVAVPAIVCAVLVLLTVREPSRGNQESAVRSIRRRRIEHSTVDSRHEMHNPLSKLSLTTARIDQQQQFRAQQSELPAAAAAAVVDEGTAATSIEVAADERGGTIPVSSWPQKVHKSQQQQHQKLFKSQQKQRQQHPYAYGGVETDPRSDATGNVEDFNRDYNSNYDDDDDDNAVLPMVEYGEKVDCTKISQLFYTPSVVIVFAQGFPGCLPWGMIYVFLNDYFSSDRGMSVEEATAALTTFGVGGLFGQMIGGWWGQWLYNRDPRYQCVLMGVSTLLSVFPLIYLLNTSAVGGVFFYTVSFCAGFIVNMNGPNVRTVLQNVCAPEVRGTAFALFSLTDDIGKGLGPALVVVFIQACGGNEHRREAFNIVVLFWLFCGVMLLSLTCTVLHDEAAVQAAVRRAVERYQSQQHHPDEEKGGNTASSSSRSIASGLQQEEDNINGGCQLMLSSGNPALYSHLLTDEPSPGGSSAAVSGGGSGSAV